MKFTFMNTWEEWHSFVEGWCEGISPRTALIGRSEAVKDMIGKEHWYYMFGHALASLTWVGIVLASIRIIKGG